MTRRITGLRLLNRSPFNGRCAATFYCELPLPVRATCCYDRVGRNAWGRNWH